MNQQPPEIVGQLFTVLFFLIAGFYALISKQKYSDNFQIGYISEAKVTNVKINNPITIKKVKQTTKQTNPFQQECIETLVSLGETKKSAKDIVDNIFSQKSPKTLEEFVKVAFQK